jgi:stage V sporulation protein G
MEITEVRVKLMEDADDRLRAFCSVTFDDCFVVRDLKIIDGVNGPFVAMPSRKLTSHCPQCGAKNHLRAAYCNQCGAKLPDDRTVRDQDGRVKLYADIAHPINAACREMIQVRVIAEFTKELERAKQPGYVSRYDEGYVEDAGDVVVFEREPVRSTPSSAGSTTKIEPAQTTPPAPHQVPKETRTGTPERRGPREFGAGIFDP